MKIGVITSGVDMLVLFRFLAKYDFSYQIVYDQLAWPWADKSFDYVLERATKAIDHLLAQGCEKIIVPPVVEVALHHDKKYGGCILPLRTNYLLNECMPHSPVGKIAFAGEYIDLTQQALFESICTAYEPNAKQQERVAEIAKKKSSYKWGVSFRWHEIVMRKYYLTKLSFKSQIVHHAMKADWAYFKDAGADTIIPTNYGFFAYEAALGKFLNTKKQRFHRLSAVERQFSNLITNYELPITSYSLSISYTGTLDHLTREKKRMWMLQRGKEITVEMNHITF